MTDALEQSRSADDASAQKFAYASAIRYFGRPILPPRVGSACPAQPPARPPTMPCSLGRATDARCAHTAIRPPAYGRAWRWHLRSATSQRPLTARTQTPAVVVVQTDGRRSPRRIRFPPEPPTAGQPPAPRSPAAAYLHSEATPLRASPHCAANAVNRRHTFAAAARPLSRHAGADCAGRCRRTAAAARRDAPSGGGAARSPLVSSRPLYGSCVRCRPRDGGGDAYQCGSPRVRTHPSACPAARLLTPCCSHLVRKAMATDRVQQASAAVQSGAGRPDRVLTSACLGRQACRTIRDTRGLIAEFELESPGALTPSDRDFLERSRAQLTSAIGELGRLLHGTGPADLVRLLRRQRDADDERYFREAPTSRPATADAGGSARLLSQATRRSLWRKQEGRQVVAIQRASFHLRGKLMRATWQACDCARRRRRSPGGRGAKG